MAMQVADAFVRMVVDEKDLEKSISSASGPAGKAATGAGQTAGDAYSKAFGGSVRSKIGGALQGAKEGIFQGIGLGVGLGVAGIAAQAGTALVEGIGHSITAASDLAETVSKVGVVFGREGDAILKWGDNAATALGQSKQQALEAAGTFGNLFVSMGLAQPKAADMSTSMVELASDLASFNNTSPEETLLALRSGLVGETEPLRRFGVNLNEATLKQKALDLGLTDSTEGTLPAAVKAQAAYALILEQTKTAQGDFARTSGGLANQQRIASAKVEDAFARIGQALAPLAAKIVPLLADAFVVVAEVLGEVFDVIGPLIGFFIDLAKVLFPIGKAIFDVLITPFKILIEVVGGVVDFFKDAIRNIADFVAGIPGPWQEAAAGVRDALDNMDKEMAIDAASASAAIPPTVAGELASGEGMVTAGAETMVDGVPGAVSEASDAAGAEAAKTPGEIADGIGSDRDSIDNAFRDLKDQIANAMSPAKERAHLEGILTSKRLARGLKSKDAEVRLAAEQIRLDAQERLEALKGGAGKAGTSAGKSFAGGIKETKPAVRDAAKTAVQPVMPVLEMSSQADNWGKRTAAAYAAGIRAGRIAVRNAASDVAATARTIFRATSPPGPASPLHHIDKWGQATGEAWGDGLAGGVRDSRSAIVSALGMVIRASDVPSFATGSLNVPADMFAMVHRGEMIIPADEAEVLRRGRAGLAGRTTPVPKGGDTFNINVPIEGLVRARNPLEVVTQLQRMADFGVLVPIKPEPS